MVTCRSVGTQMRGKDENVDMRGVGARIEPVFLNHGMRTASSVFSVLKNEF